MSAHADAPDHEHAQEHGTPPDSDRQHAFKIRPNPAFGVDAAWWTGVLLQQACEEVLHRDGA